MTSPQLIERPDPKETALRVGELVETLKTFDPDLPVLLDRSCGCCGRVEWIVRDEVIPKVGADYADGTPGVHIGYEDADDPTYDSETPPPSI